MALAIHLNQVSKHFGEFPALVRVSGQIRPGEKVCLLGHNGAGKSTLLTMLATISKPSSGSITYQKDGHNLEKKSQIRAKLAYLSHESMLYPDLTAIENLIFTNRIYGLNKSLKQMTAALEQVSMGAAANRLTRTCSRGMRQRISLARALLLNPELLLLDEPFSGLDHPGVMQLRTILSQIQATMVLVTHHLTLGFELADTLWVLKKGRISQNTPKSALDLASYLQLMETEMAAGVPA